MDLYKAFRDTNTTASADRLQAGLVTRRHATAWWLHLLFSFQMAVGLPLFDNNQMKNDESQHMVPVYIFDLELVIENVHLTGFKRWNFSIKVAQRLRSLCASGLYLPNVSLFCQDLDGKVAIIKSLIAARPCTL